MTLSRTLWGIAAALLLQAVVAAAQQVPGRATAPTPTAVA
jgi:hypothetical protein